MEGFFKQLSAKKPNNFHSETYIFINYNMLRVFLPKLYNLMKTCLKI